MKQTIRAKDVPDRLYLKQLLDAQGVRVDGDAVMDDVPAPGRTWWAWLKRWLRR
jgi:hypothetical protein